LIFVTKEITLLFCQDEEKLFRVESNCLGIGYTGSDLCSTNLGGHRIEGVISPSRNALPFSGGKAVG